MVDDEVARGQQGVQGEPAGPHPGHRGGQRVGHVLRGGDDQFPVEALHRPGELDQFGHPVGPRDPAARGDAHPGPVRPAQHPRLQRPAQVGGDEPHGLPGAGGRVRGAQPRRADVHPELRHGQSVQSGPAEFGGQLGGGPGVHPGRLAEVPGVPHPRDAEFVGEQRRRVAERPADHEVRAPVGGQDAQPGQGGGGQPSESLPVEADPLLRVAGDGQFAPGAVLEHEPAHGPVGDGQDGQPGARDVRGHVLRGRDEDVMAGETGRRGERGEGEHGRRTPPGDKEDLHRTDGAPRH
ncbi:hypothetical protein GCM10010215_46900 [Streptomyces virginiae]|nr:hypothetical protein GCM10010215_46900 [Streptomyces virginiae]